MKTGITGNFGRKGWAMIIYTIFLFMLSGVASDSMNILFPALSASTGWDYATMIALPTPGAVLCAVIVAGLGVWIQKKGTKPATILSLIIAILAWALASFMPVIGLFAVMFMLMSGFDTALNLCSAQTLISNWFPRKKGIALGWATVGMCLSGCILIPIMNGLVSGSGGSVVSSFLFIAALHVVALIITIIWVKNTPEEADFLPDNEPITEHERKELAEADTKGVYTTKELLKTKQTWLLIFAFSFLFMGLLGVIMMIIPRLTAVGYSQDSATIIYMVSTIVGIVGSVVWGILDQRLGTKPVTVVYSVLWTIMLFLSGLFAYQINKVGTLVSVIFFAILFGGLPNLFASCVIWVFGRFDFPGANKVISTVVSLIRTLGILIVSIMMGMAQIMVVGIGQAYLVLAAFSLVGTICVFLLNRKGIRSVNTSEM